MPDLVRLNDYKAARLQVLEHVVFGELSAICAARGVVQGRWHIDARKKALILCRIRDRLMDVGVQPARYGFEKYAIATSSGERWFSTSEELR